ncbi:MAG: phosphate-binding protein [Chlorobium limicola]|nr:phosphate-binding protein [Chlorobium limicola]
MMTLIRDKPLAENPGKTEARNNFMQAVRRVSLLLLILAGGCVRNTGTIEEHRSAVSGKLHVAVDKPLDAAVRAQTGIFRAHYPEASFTVEPDISGKTLLALLKGKADAVLINGSTTPAEDSLLADPKRPGRKEAVARDAIICIVNRNCPADSITVDRIVTMLSGQNHAALPLVPWITRNDYRLLTTLRHILKTSGKPLHAMQTDSDSLLAVKVASDPRAAGLLYLSALKTLSLPDSIGNRIRILPASGTGEHASRAILPSEQALFDGSYPLATVVYYIYLPGDPLAAGFGSWLSKEGQKGFERSYLAPFRQMPRTIILK